MISQIDLKHFKCFEKLKLPLGSLTVLSGGNSSGKSTIIQPFVLLHQTMRENEWSKKLILNGSSVHLGNVSSIVDKEHGYRTWELTLVDDVSGEIIWLFEGDRKELSMEVLSIDGNLDYWSKEIPNQRPLRRLIPVEPYPKFEDLTNRLYRLTYLSAERLGPREIYPFNDSQLTPVVGSKGEFSASVLFNQGDEEVVNELVISNYPNTLLRQVEGRMDQFFPSTIFEINQIHRTNALTLGFQVSGETDFQRPIHTGFGLTQVLPIFVATLSAKQNDLVIIENPEVHLHPAAQSEMGKFLTKVAAAGIQVILETHSDHILNGIRREVKSGTLLPDKLALHFFRPRNDESGSQVESPMIDSEGNLDSWPEGFFDQIDKDMNFFAGWA